MPSISVDIDLVLVTPATSRDRTVMIMFRNGSAAGSRRTSAARVLEPPPAPGDDPPATEQLIAAGWGYALLNPSSIQADNGAGLTRGIIGLVNKGQPRKPDDWGSLRAWAWGAARALDYLETDPAVDATRVGIEGVSRYGKAALVTMAFEPRFAMVLVGSSGEGGAKLHRRNFGEAVENLTGSGEYHWMAGNFLKYGAGRSKFGSRNAGDLPVDAHQLIALCAPRLDVHQLRHPGERRREVAGPAGQLHGRCRRRPGVPPARCEGISGRPTTTGRRRCRRSMSAYSTANWPGGSTTAATPTVRTGSYSSSGPTSSSAGNLPGESGAGTGSARLDGNNHSSVGRQRRTAVVLDSQNDVRCARDAWRNGHAGGHLRLRALRGEAVREGRRPALTGYPPRPDYPRRRRAPAADRHRLTGDAATRFGIEEPLVSQALAIGIARARRIERQGYTDRCGRQIGALPAWPFTITSGL